MDCGEEGLVGDEAADVEVVVTLGEPLGGFGGMTEGPSAATMVEPWEGKGEGRDRGRG